jgi:hypothetical protein
MTDTRQNTGFNMNNLFVYLLVTVSLLLGAWGLNSTTNNSNKLSSLQTLTPVIEKLDKTLVETSDDLETLKINIRQTT